MGCGCRGNAVTAAAAPVGFIVVNNDNGQTEEFTDYADARAHQLEHGGTILPKA